MSDEVFSPFPSPAGGKTPGSAEVLYLQRALFVLQGRFFDPIAKADKPLPPHRFALAQSETVFSEGSTSDADGVSTIFAPDTTGVADDATWELYLIPIFAGRPDSDAYATDGEAWIDLDTRKWVTSEDVKQDKSMAILTTRKLLRIPVWSSARKAATGGFAATPPSASDFGTTGLLRTSELQPFGNKSNPWVVQVDHQWLRTWVSLRCWDPVAKKNRTLPPSVLVTSTQGFGKVVGGSSVMLPDGSIYLVHAGRKEDLSKLAYEFSTPEVSFFTYADGKTVVREDKSFDNAELATHYPLPRAWCSLGQRPWLGTGEPSSSNRKPFADLRHDGTSADNPLSFHLDDLVITTDGAQVFGVDNDGKWIAKSDRITVFDSLLAIRKQAKQGSDPMPWSDLPFTTQPLAAEDHYYVADKGPEAITRVLEHEGRLFGVDRRRVRGLPGFDPCVGARAAKLSRGITLSRSELHLFDTRWVTHEYKGKPAPLAHVMAYVPTFIDAPKADDPATGPNLARTMGIPRCLKLMAAAAAVWNQGHPGNHAAPSPAKRYAIVPEGGLKDKQAVILSRAHFGVRKLEDRIDFNGNVDKKIRILIHPQAGRATGGDPMHLYLVYGDTILAPPVPNPPVPGKVFDFEPAGDSVGDRVDDVESIPFTLAHELGHSMDLPDEYVERAHPPDKAAGSVAAFQSWFRPFNHDFTSFMRGNHVPRLRYLWPHVMQLQTLAVADEFAWLKPQLPLVVEYEAPKAKMRYQLPKGAGKFADAPTPWSMRSDNLGLAELGLFLAGDDESTRGPIILPPKKLTDPFDGVVVVVTKFWFTFDDSISEDKDRWELLYDEFVGTYYDREECPKFFLQSSGPWLTRVLVLFQPRIEFGPKPSKRDDGTVEAVASADIEVRVRKGDRSRTTGKPHVLCIRKGDMGHFLMRYALSPTQAVFDDRKNKKLQADDLAGINGWFSNLFGRSSKVVPL